MNSIIVLTVLGLTYAVLGIRLDGFRVRHAFASALRDKEYFYDIPRTAQGAEAAGFHSVPRNYEDGFEVDMRCLDGDVRVCPLYDHAGYIAGLQIAIPMQDLVNLPYDISTRLVPKNILGEDYWTTSNYVVSPATTKNGGRQGPIDETIEDLWVRSGHILKQIPMYEDEIASQTLYKKQNCIPNMGTHYYYNMTPELDCQLQFPYTALVKEGRVIGLSWQIMGITAVRDRHWFENQTARGVEMAIPTAPACLSEWVTTYGVTSLHMFYIDEPWTIRCEPGDNLRPMSIVNQFLLTSSHYATIVMDEARRLLG